MTPYQTEHQRGLERQRKEEAFLIARADELTGGAPLKFGAGGMNSALRAFVDFVKVSERFRGHEGDYLRRHPATTILGTPTCTACDQQFSSERSYARHKMSYRHVLRDHGASHEAVMEFRAHLHAFPIPEEEWFSQDFREIETVYAFRNLPAEDGNVPGVPRGQSAFPDDLWFGLSSSNVAELQERMSAGGSWSVETHVESLVRARKLCAEASERRFANLTFRFLDPPQLEDTMLVGISRYYLNHGENPWFETLAPRRRAVAKARIKTLRDRLERGFSLFFQERHALSK